MKQTCLNKKQLICIGSAIDAFNFTDNMVSYVNALAVITGEVKTIETTPELKAEKALKEIKEAYPGMQFVKVERFAYCKGSHGVVSGSLDKLFVCGEMGRVLGAFYAYCVTP